MIKESSLESFGSANIHTEKQSWLGKLLSAAGRFTYAKAKPILVVILLITAVALYGITRIQINDNPVKWFSKSHPIRRADIELNEHFGGTYMAYLVLEPADDKAIPTKYISDLRKRLLERTLELKDEFPRAVSVMPELEKTLLEQASAAETKQGLLEKLSTYTNNKLDTAKDKDVDLWYELTDFFELQIERIKPFKGQGC